ncbi:MAG: extracellular solute-binding protein [Bacteroidota bacterium]
MKLKYLILSFFILSCGNKKEERTKITIWHQMRVDERVILQSQIEKFMLTHPKIKVEQVYKETEEMRSGFIIAAVAGQGAEIVYGPNDNIGVFSSVDIILPLDTLFDKKFISQFNPKALTYYKNHLFQIADKLGNHLALVYNKKLLKTPPKTTDELIEIGKKLTKDFNNDGKIDQYALVWNYTEPFFFIPFYTGFGGWVMDDEFNPTLNNYSMVRALEFMRNLRDSAKIIPRESDYQIADALFKDEKSAMIINGDWSWSSYVKAGIDIGVAPLPIVNETGLNCAPMISPKGYSVNKNISNEKLIIVKELLEFLLNEENQLEATKLVSTIPTQKSLYSNPYFTNNEIMVNSQKQIDLGRSMPIVPEMRAIWDAMRPHYQAVLNGAKSPKQSANDMQIDSKIKIKEMLE